MTKQEINEYIALRRELTEALNLRDALRIAAEPGAQNLTGQPHASGYTDKVGNLAVEIADISGEIERLQSCLQAREGRVLEFITAIQDNRARIIFRLRVLHTMSWPDIAKAIGGPHTAHSVRNAYHRQFKKF